MIKSRHIIVLIIVFIISVIGMQSCTIEKRIYMPGHHIKWKNKKLKYSNIQILNYLIMLN